MTRSTVDDVDICVLGAGSLGSVIGGTLARDGHRVSLVTRNAAHVGAIGEHGLQLATGEQTVTVELDATTDVTTCDPPDVMIVLVKSFDTAAAIDDARALIGDHTTVLTLQNGVGCEEVIGQAIGLERVIAGRTFVGGSMLRPGVVSYGVAGRRTVLGELHGDVTERLTRVADAFEHAGMAVDISRDIVAMMWEKLFVNVATGAWSALTGLPYGELSRHGDVEAMAIATVAEAMAVASGLGVAIETTDPSVPWRRAWEGLPHGFRASMLQSVDKGSRTEVDVMHGAVCDGGRRAGIATPINDTLLAAVHGLERRLEIEASGSGSALRH